MNKYLFAFLLLFIVNDIYAAPIINIIDGNAEIIEPGSVSFDSISNQSDVVINQLVIIDNFRDWQNWDPNNVQFEDGAKLRITNTDNIKNGEKIKHVDVGDDVNITIQNTNRLYRVNMTPDLYIHIVRETNYENVFHDNRGRFLENIRLNNPNDKMLMAMDAAKDMNEVNSIMNSSYHFNPIILMNPIKTINRAAMNDMFMNKEDDGIGANVDYITSDKISSIGTRIYLASKYNDLYFNVGVNLNRFSYSDNLNEFDGFAYGLNLRARQYLDDLWLDGLLGINRAVFSAGDIYKDGNTFNNPKGISEYARLHIRYDFTKISDVVFSPFVGMMFQKSDIVGYSDNDINLHTGLIGKYDFVMDGIKYEYGAIIATDEKANWNIGANIGFESVIDKAGAFVQVDAFKDEFGTNYKFTINAKTEF